MNATWLNRSLRIAGTALALTTVIASLPLAAFAEEAPSSVRAAISLPTGKRLTAFSKDAYGGTCSANVVTKICHNQLTQEIDNLYLRAKVTPANCDENFSKYVLNGYLIAYSDVIRRLPDRRGAFDGRWRLIRPDGYLLAAGTWTGTVGVGTHRPVGTKDCEDCSEPEHYEGKMTGKVYVPGVYYGSEIQATLAGTGPLQPYTAQRISMEGIVITPCYVWTAREYELPDLGKIVPDLDVWDRLIDVP